ncbi:hypothetical protein MPAR168_22270 [Methylorubrum populi]|uniref:Uncharacterized protein n=1 Tax=Methylobacterium radiotolerans TaxID=31998 RepID=A0ABU7TH22_9HYPH
MLRFNSRLRYPLGVSLTCSGGEGQGLSLDPVKAWKIDKAVGPETKPSEANRDARLAAARRRMLAAGGG